jgi:DNA transposition AAA+ family ATPase
MQETGKEVYGVAPLDNVARMAALIDRCGNRANGLPGMGCLYGRAGRGKTTAAIWATNAHHACHVEAMDIGGVRGLLGSIVEEMGLKPGRSTMDMFKQAAGQLARTGQPLLIDEADHILNERAINAVRRLHDVSQAPVILIGEELLPQRLQKWERVHSRMLSWVAMEDVSAQDVDHLAKIYARGLTLGPDLKSALLKASNGSHRNVVTNLAGVSEFAAIHGMTNLSLAEWGGRAFHTGEAPPPRGLPMGLRRRGIAA